MSADSRLFSLLEEAELHLVQHKYLAAETKAQRALQAASALPDPQERVRLGDRAAVVLLQALYETNRFASARPCLCDAFGSLGDAPPTTVLLWLSLSLDTEERCHCETLLLQLLQSKDGAPGWRRRQYIALLHLYLIEVLLPALKDASQVRLWLQRQPFLPLDPRERQYLEDEIDAAAAAAPSREDSLSAEEAARRLNTVNIRTLGSSPTNWSVPAADSRRGLGQEVAAPDTDADADDACSVQSSDIAGLDLATAPHFSPTPSWRGRGKSPSPAPSSAQVQEGRGMGPGEGPSDADRTGSLRPHSRPGSNDALEDLDWLGRLQRAAFSATSSAYQGTLALLQPVAASRNADQGGPSSGVNPADQAPDAAGVATGVGLVLLALAVYAERDVLKRSVASVGRGVARGLAELAAMGLSLTPNPMAHSPVNRPR